MNRLKLSENLAFLRRRSGRTQEELAVFLGVTKASVSKWETGQSFPDIMLLPRLASYFDISVDELIGYQAQLTREEIRKIYIRFTEDFENRPFEEVMEESREFVKEYYSCYPALLQISVLWLNHYMLADTREENEAILQEIVSLCLHIEQDCGDREICGDAELVRYMVFLLLGKTEEVTAALEPRFQPEHLSDQIDTLLVQAYQMAGRAKDAKMFNQSVIFRHLVMMINDSLTYLMSQLQDREGCQETIDRLHQIIEIYHIDRLHPNLYLQFCYACALFYMAHGQKKEALEQLEIFVEGTVSFIKEGIRIYGDSYFSEMDQYVQKYDLLRTPPRGKKVIWDSVMGALDNPVFAPISECREMKRWKQKLKEGREKI